MRVIQPETVLALAPSRHRLKFGNTDRLIAGEVNVRGLPLETRQLIREIAHANFLWGAPRIHGELLKLGIRAPLPRHKCRRTFIRNLTITIVQSPSFSAIGLVISFLSSTHNRGSYVSPLSTCRRIGRRSIMQGRLVCGASTPHRRGPPRVSFTRIATPTTKSTALVVRQSVAAGSTNSRAIRSSRATISCSVPGQPDNRAISSTPASRYRFRSSALIGLV